MPWRLVFIQRVGDSPYWAQKPRGPDIYGTGHCFTNTRKLEKNPPCNAEDNLRAGLIVIEAWFGGY